MPTKESKPFYHTAAWKRARAAALARDCGMCQDCMDRMRDGIGIRPRRATMVHHLIPYTERPDLALRLDNLRSLCDACHEKRHPERRQRRGDPEEPAHQMRVVRV